MQVVIHKSRRNCRTCTAVAVVRRTPAEHAVVSGKHEAQLGHASTQARCRLDQNDAQADLSEINRSPHAANPATNDHDPARATIGVAVTVGVCQV